MMHPTRLVSLDIFRGLTVAVMILVNSPGNQTSYRLLAHAPWNGCTLADLVFPFFIFIAAVSSVFTISHARTNHLPRHEILFNIFKRTLILFFTGLLLNAFPHHFDFATLRIYGVLQRIALCYCAGSILFFSTRIRTQALLIPLLLIGYWLIMVPHGASSLTLENNFAAYLDRCIFSAAHLYGKTYDPEGLFSTLPALATALLGNLTGAWLLSPYQKEQKLKMLYIVGISAGLTGWVWGLWFPINKTLWTSSYVLWTGGIALIVLACCYWIIDIKNWNKWAKPIEIFGLNALLAFVLHVVFLKIQAIILISRGDGSVVNLKQFMTECFFSWTSLQNASLMYACSYLLFWLIFIYRIQTLHR